MKTQLFLIPVFLLVFFASIPVLPADDVFIRDILDNPQKYFNLEVRVQGEVVDVNIPPSRGERGSYILMDNSDRQIRIVANTLPAPQDKLVVEGVVQLDTITQTPFVREGTRAPLGASPRAGSGGAARGAEPGQTNWTVIILAGAIVVILILLLVVIFRKPADGKSTAAPPPPAAIDPNTRQVSMEEVDRETGGLRTKQVPSLLAEVRVKGGILDGKAFPLGFETRIGRIKGDIILEDASVSREHALIRFHEDHYVIRNLSGTNPIIINGEKAEIEKDLTDGDEIVIGVIRLQFVLT